MALERLFSFKEGGTPTSYDPGDPNSYSQFIHALITDARDYENSVLAPARDLATKYYMGLIPTLNPDGTPYSDTLIIQDPNATFGDILGPDNEIANKSSYVSTDVKDAVQMMLPSLVRIFCASENVVNLVPRTAQDVTMASQATNYVNYVFWQDNPGFLILLGAFKDAMIRKAGFVKWWTDDNTEVRNKTWQNITDQQLQVILSQDQTAKLVEKGRPDEWGRLDRVVVRYEIAKPITHVEGVPPEEMRLDRYARNFSDSRIVGHQRIVSLDWLTARGYDRNLAANFLQTQDVRNFTMEAMLRNPGRAMSTRVGDGVLYGEWYCWIDTDGDGIPELRYICTMGENDEIVYDVAANRIKFACFGCDPVPHTIIGDSISDLTEDIQRIKTNMMRGVLDSLAESINPKTVVNELMVTLDDALNDDLGAVIRTRGDPNNTVAFATTPFVGQQALPILELLDNYLSRRTGLTDAAKGLDPKVLQSSTAIGVDAVINGAQERTELVARVLAETGFKDLFIGLFNEVCENPNQKRTLRINGTWQEYDTSTFDASMGVEVNPTLGKGSDLVRMATLQQIKNDQMAIFQNFGPQNPVVGIQEMLNTVTDMLSIANIKNVGRYFKTPDPQTLAMIAQAPKEPDAQTLAARSLWERVKSDNAQKIGDQQITIQKQQQDNAFRQEQLRQKAMYDAQKLAIERAKVGMGQRPEEVDPVEVGKLGVDMHKAHLDAAMREREMQMQFATDQAKIEQQRQAAILQAQAAMMKPTPGNGAGN